MVCVDIVIFSPQVAAQLAYGGPGGGVLGAAARDATVAAASHSSNGGNDHHRKSFRSGSIRSCHSIRYR